MGFAMETNVDWHRGDFGVIVPTMKGWTSPVRIDHGQKNMDLFYVTESWLPAEIHVSLSGPVVRVGVSQGSGRVPF